MLWMAFEYSSEGEKNSHFLIGKNSLDCNWNTGQQWLKYKTVFMGVMGRNVNSAETIYWGNFYWTIFSVLLDFSSNLA